MKDYYLSERKNMDFIKTYEINEDTIKLNLASKKKHSLLKNTLENRNRINWIMNSQAKQVYCYTRKRFIFFLIALLFNILTFIITLNLLSGICLIVSAVAPIWFGYDFLDAKKNKDFYLNATELNKKLETDPNLLNGIKGKTKEMLINQPKEEPIFNYNSVDKLTYLELRQILVNLRISNQLNFDYAESQRTILQQEAYTRNLHKKKGKEKSI